MASVEEQVERKRPAEPVEAKDRVRSVDVLRGVALLGILAMNIVAFAWPDGVDSNPLLDPGAGSLDVGLWALNHVVFDTKMMSLFSMLFGAGLVLMADRARARGTRLVWVYYRRIFWLLVIGLIHAYLIWGGDILVEYAACGFLLYPLRKLRPRTLIVIGLCLNLVFVPMFLGFRAYLVPFLRETAARAEAKERAGQPVKEWEKSVRDSWKEITTRDSREGFLKEMAWHRSSYFQVVKHRASEVIWMHLLGIPFVMIELSGGRMLIGMGLMKLGVFSTACSRRTYLTMMLVGYGLGLPLMGLDVYNEMTHGFFADHWIDRVLHGGFFLTLLGSLPVVFGHIGAVMLVCQSQALPWLTRRLAAVGQMALSNYLFHSILFTTVFNGYGLDLYGSIHRPMLYVFVLLVWAFQLWLSPVWLASFRYGPAEWVWRSLTYGKLQPLCLPIQSGR
ncbi:MAG: DUF418 domain-containing protein [Isosphaeraceae bacterium]|nr:DUF418 domain-containing protein [Isosphaeraceae bacterium]